MQLFGGAGGGGEWPTAVLHAAIDGRPREEMGFRLVANEENDEKKKEKGEGEREEAVAVSLAAY